MTENDCTSITSGDVFIRNGKEWVVTQIENDLISVECKETDEQDTWSQGFINWNDEIHKQKAIRKSTLNK